MREVTWLLQLGSLSLSVSLFLSVSLSRSLFLSRCVSLCISLSPQLGDREGVEALWRGEEVGFCLLRKISKSEFEISGYTA